MNKKAGCLHCGAAAEPVASVLGACVRCVREASPEVEEWAVRAHRTSRTEFGLPVAIPQDDGGALCTLCVNECRIPEHGVGYCGLRAAEGRKVVSKVGTAARGAVQWYFDPLPTNCVAAWVCPECRGMEERPFRSALGRTGRKNLAVFYESCTFDCLFCQNWHFRDGFREPHLRSAEELAAACDAATACICYFGGDPASQMEHALAAARSARERNPALRVCWETNGSASWGRMRRAADISVESGGIVKFDLKAWNEDLHRALTGSSNRNTLDNFRRVAAMGAARPDTPLVIGSTLLVPGYVEEEEVTGIARFLADLDRSIPYSLLAFHPDHCFFDLPVTSRALAERCLAACTEVGLSRVHLGNRHLLT